MQSHTWKEISPTRKHLAKVNEIAEEGKYCYYCVSLVTDTTIELQKGSKLVQAQFRANISKQLLSASHSFLSLPFPPPCTCPKLFLSFPSLAFLSLPTAFPFTFPFLFFSLYYLAGASDIRRSGFWGATEKQAPQISLIKCQPWEGLFCVYTNFFARVLPGEKVQYCKYLKCTLAGMVLFPNFPPGRCK